MYDKSEIELDSAERNTHARFLPCTHASTLCKGVGKHWVCVYDKSETVLDDAELMSPGNTSLTVDLLHGTLMLACALYAQKS